MNPQQVFKTLVDATVFNCQASMFLQAISGHVPDNDPDRLIKNLKHIQKEAQEGIEALEDLKAKIDAGTVTDADYTIAATKTRDAYADVRVLLDGSQQMHNFPLAEDYAAVLSSLITRFDKPEVNVLFDEAHHAKLTQEKYNKLHVETRIHFDTTTGMYVNIVVNGSQAADPSEYPAGKWLKSYKYQEPRLDEACCYDIARKVTPAA